MSDPYRRQPSEPRYRVVIDGRAYHVEKWRDAIRAMRAEGISQAVINEAGATVVTGNCRGVRLDLALDRRSSSVTWIVRPIVAPPLGPRPSGLRRLVRRLRDLW